MTQFFFVCVTYTNYASAGVVDDLRIYDAGQRCVLNVARCQPLEDLGERFRCLENEKIIIPTTINTPLLHHIALLASM